MGQTKEMERRARRRALRAAQVVTLGLALAGGCYADHGNRSESPTPDAAHPEASVPDARADAVVPNALVPDALVPDALVPDVLVPDARVPDSETGDAGLGDALADAGQCLPGEQFTECCNAVDWDIHWGCFAWGPGVPPGDEVPRHGRG